MKLVRLVVLGILGPLVALVVVWQAAVTVAIIVPAGKAPDPDVVARLRAEPDEAILKELGEFAVSYPSYRNLAPEDVLQISDSMLAGQYVLEGTGDKVQIPFEPAPYLFKTTTEHLTLHSFSVPSVLGRAYDVSKDTAYLQAAVKYILAWSKYESSLILPRGFFFNDHAIAARSIVVTEIWRLYRSSDVYQVKEATAILGYAQRLARLLLDERLYEYRTNHGIMQSLSLIHLATAFPLLDVAKPAFDAGWERLRTQLEFFVNEEGVILEHSPSYHLNGLKRLAAAWRYLGLNGIAVPDEMIRKYEHALDFNGALQRPDGTLAVIGDTGDRAYFLNEIAVFDSGGVVSRPLRETHAADRKPAPLTFAAGAGYVVLWSGLQHWPEGEGLVQTVFHWANFPTKVHKHADELAISIWADGHQWVRAVGSWPYIPSRRDAIGWRSSNGPHWVGESAESDRQLALEAFALSDDLWFFDVIRENADGRTIRRQLVKLGPTAWIVVDSFGSADPGIAETVWRFSPGFSLQSSSGKGYDVSATNRKMSISFASPGEFHIDADDGHADWNSGLISGGEIVGSPALRVLTSSDRRPVATAFELHELTKGSASAQKIAFRWANQVEWEVDLFDNEDKKVTVERRGNLITTRRVGTSPTEIWLSTEIPRSSRYAMRKALDSYENAAQRYGESFQPMLARRAKISGVIIFATAIQIAFFPIVRRRFPSWWRPAVTLSLSVWLGLSLYLGLNFTA